MTHAGSDYCAFLTADEKVPGRQLPLYPVRRWRKSLDDLAEAHSLVAGGGSWLANRALSKCERRLTAAEKNLDGYLDKTIRKFRLKEEWADFSSMSDEDWGQIDRLMEGKSGPNVPGADI